MPRLGSKMRRLTDWLFRSHPQLKKGALFDFGIKEVRGRWPDEPTKVTRETSAKEPETEIDLLNQVWEDIRFYEERESTAPFYWLSFTEPFKLTPVEWYDRAYVRSSDGQILRRSLAGPGPSLEERVAYFAMSRRSKGYWNELVEAVKGLATLAICAVLIIVILLLSSPLWKPAFYSYELPGKTWQLTANIRAYDSPNTVKTAHREMTVRDSLAGC